jgi:hypothetical protein
MRHIPPKLALALIAPLAASVLSGCASEPGTLASVSPNGTYKTASSTVPYADGSYKMYDSPSGSYWVWVPKGANEFMPPPPPAVPAPAQTAVIQPAPAQVVVQPAVPARTVMAGGGQYTLYGNGTTAPYYWVWVPAGINAPPPPPLAR